VRSEILRPNIKRKAGGQAPFGVALACLLAAYREHARGSCCVVSRFRGDRVCLSHRGGDFGGVVASPGRAIGEPLPACRERKFCSALERQKPTKNSPVSFRACSMVMVMVMVMVFKAQLLCSEDGSKLERHVFRQLSTRSFQCRPFRDCHSCCFGVLEL